MEVPAVGLGTWQVLDVRGSEEESRHEVVRVALEEGANLFDSSPMYGQAERVLGDALQEHGRERAIVATKVWTSNDREAQRQIERALGYFGGRVELYQVHNLVAVERRLQSLHSLKDQGEVLSVGATHYSRAAFGDLMSVMRSGRADFDVYPDDASCILAEGVVRARYRDGYNRPSLIQPGEVYAYEIDLVATSNVFRPGHRIRVDVTSSSFPYLDRNSNTGNPLGEDGPEDLQPAVQTVFHDVARPSHLVLPVIPR